MAKRRLKRTNRPLKGGREEQFLSKETKRCMLCAMRGGYRLCFEIAAELNNIMICVTRANLERIPAGGLVC